MLVHMLCPEREIVKIDVISCTIPGADGYITILPGHTRLVTEIGVGIVHLETEAEVKRYFISGGFAEVNNEGLDILADMVEVDQEIDVARAKESRYRAQKRLYNATGVDIDRSLASLKRAEIRLQLVT